MFFGGKGGVGKTTCAAARSVAIARAGLRVLVVSTDPAHSLGDALGVRLSHRITTVAVGRAPRRGRAARAAAIDAVELDAPRVFARWLGEHRQALGDVLEHGTWLERVDVEALIHLPIPGLDELIGLLEIVRLAGVSAYDAVVVDTAPTGHTLRLLASADTVAAVSAILDDLQRDHRAIRQQLTRVLRPEAADRLIELLAQQAAGIGELLRDGTRTAFHWVMLAEELSLAETADGLAALRRGRIRVPEIIANRIIPDGPPCPICDRRRVAERRVLARARRMSGKLRAFRIVYEDPREPRGIGALVAVGTQLTSPAAALSGKNITARARRNRAAVGMCVSGREGTAGPESVEAFLGARLLFFGGKGGVGKTTTAAAVAIALARASSSRRVLLLSTDPAHSLADVLRWPVGDRKAPIRGGPSNLDVRELDAAGALADRRAALEGAIDEIVAAFGADSFGAGGGRGVSELVDLAPPGTDELFGVLSVVDSHEQYDTIVVDTAPTGHALRLLEMPDAAREWVQVLLRVLLKYRGLVRPGLLAGELVELSKSVRRLQDLLHDRSRTRFVVVTRAAEVPRLETERLLARLRRLRLFAPALVVNARTLAPGACPRCRAIARAERGQVARLAVACRRRSRDCVIIQAPLAAPPPQGVAALARWGRAWVL